MRTIFSLCPSGLWGKTNKYPYGAKQTPHRGRRSALIPFVTTSSQLHRYCLLWIQRGPYGFKRRLQGVYTYIASETFPLFDVECHTLHYYHGCNIEGLQVMYRFKFCSFPSKRGELKQEKFSNAENRNHFCYVL